MQTLAQLYLQYNFPSNVFLQNIYFVLNFRVLFWFGIVICLATPNLLCPQYLEKSKNCSSEIKQFSYLNMLLFFGKVNEFKGMNIDVRN